MTTDRESLHSSKTNEWYTPAAYTAAARELMGAIDLDPASSPLANQTVRAARFYTLDDDGLALDWFGRIWLNPPYGKKRNKGNAGLWAARLIAEYHAGRVAEAVLLVNASTGDPWFVPLKQFPICLPDRRIRFLDYAGREQKNPTHSNALIYLGPNVARFAAIFSRFGPVLAARSTWAGGQPTIAEQWAAGLAEGEREGAF